MMSARETLTRLRHELAPDQDAIRAAAAQVMQELKRAACSAKCEVTAENDRLIISLPAIQMGPGAATRPHVAVQFVDRHFYVWKGSRADLDAVDGIEYEPVSEHFIAGKAPAVDRLAEIIAVRLGEELPLALRSKMPPPK